VEKENLNKNQRSEIIDLRNKNDDYEKKGGPLSRIEFDKMHSKLEVLSSEMVEKTRHIQQLK
jgi:hypothetical protein